MKNPKKYPNDLKFLPHVHIGHVNAIKFILNFFGLSFDQVKDDFKKAKFG